MGLVTLRTSNSYLIPDELCEVLLFIPLAQVYNNMFEAGRGIMRDNGPLGLYRGLGVTLVEIMPYAALQFGLYDMITSAWKVCVG